MNDVIILTSYLSLKYDHHRKTQIKSDDFKYIKDFYNSVLKLNITVKIFYDNLSSKFIQKYTTDNIEFVLINRKLNYTCFHPHEFRFIAFYDYLKNSNPNILSNYKYIFTTDIRDVIINKHPIHFINEINSINTNYNNKYTLFIQKDVDEHIKDNKWANENFTKILKTPLNTSILQNYINNPLLNCGIIGGSSQTFMIFFEKFIEYIYKFKENSTDIVDMIAINYVYYHYYTLFNNTTNSTYIGGKLHSPFYKYVKSPDFCFSHK